MFLTNIFTYILLWHFLNTLAIYFVTCHHLPFSFSQCIQTRERGQYARSVSPFVKKEEKKKTFFPYNTLSAYIYVNHFSSEIDYFQVLLLARHMFQSSFLHFHFLQVRHTFPTCHNNVSITFAFKLPNRITFHSKRNQQSIHSDSYEMFVFHQNCLPSPSID